MKIFIQDLGVIHSVAIDMSKPLNVFFGPNGTGKTYLSYILNYILSKHLSLTASITNQFLGQIIDKGGFYIEKDFTNQYLLGVADVVKGNLGTIFGISDADKESMFPRMSIKLSLDNSDWNRIFKAGKLTIYKGENHLATFLPVDKNGFVKIELSSDADNVSEFVHSSEFIFALSGYFHFIIFMPNKARMITVERNSVFTFKTEILINRSDMVDSILDSAGTLDANELIARRARRYPLAVRDNLRQATDIVNIQKLNSDYAPIAEKIERNLLHGNIVITKDGDVRFRTLGNKGVEMPIYAASSIVKTLSSLVVYLKYEAHKGDLIIIDEPEMNFHPDNQVMLSRIFGELISEGLRFVISTHSDYIIREFNNLVMGSELYRKGNKKLVEESGYTEEQLLLKENIAVNFFHVDKDGSVNVESVSVDEFGFEAKSIDEAIEHQNEVTNNFYDFLKYGSDDEL